MTVAFRDTKYKLFNGTAPRGYGRWGFSYEGKEFWATGTITEAKKACREEIKKDHSKDDYVIVEIL